MNKMKKLLMLFLAAMVSVGCCSHLSVQSPIASPQSLINKTVALVIKSPEDNQYHMYCSGVWISQTKIATAQHCADLKDEEKPTVGSIIKFKTSQEVNISRNQLDSSEPHSALVLAEDMKADVAILSVIDEMPMHDYADIAAQEPQLGEEVSIVGHTGSLKYTFLKGLISAFRISDDKVSYLQISTAAYKGNSGGGAFNKEGQLVGICSRIYMAAPNVVYFVDNKHLNKLLE